MNAPGTNGSDEREQTTAAARAVVEVRTLVLVAVMAVALLLAYAVGAGHGGGSTTAHAVDTTGSATPDATTEPAAGPTIVMTGTGTATGVPDQMTYSVGIEKQASDVSAALAQASATATAVLHRLRAEGVDPKDVKTTGLSVRPVYDYSGGGPGVIVGYSASEHLRVAVDDLARSGRVLSATADAGGNDVRISGIKLGIADKDALMKRARRDAVAEATAKAQEYADATGQTLGKVISVREVLPGAEIPPVPAVYDDGRALDQTSGSIVPIRGGRSPLDVTVAVVWTLGS